MKIYYWNDQEKCPLGNFGDQLNVWLWPQLIPEILSTEEDKGCLVGIGTLLSTILPVDRPLAIFGSGYGYGKIPYIRNEWKIYCVRGPLTASELKLDSKLAVTDAALLTRSCYEPACTNSNLQEIAFMPHWQTPEFPWREACKEVGISYIHPSEPVKDILEKISGAKMVYAEAMHGAILADSFRVPWVPISTRPSINTFKWLDWCGSMAIEYRPVKLHWKRFTPNLVSQNCSSSLLAKIFACESLNRLNKTKKSQLSQDKVLLRKEEMLLEKLELFKKDWKMGLFF
jgi:succinoglycan biosynthesis protein ExoV